MEIIFKKFSLQSDLKNIIEDKFPILINVNKTNGPMPISSKK